VEPALTLRRARALALAAALLGGAALPAAAAEPALSVPRLTLDAALRAAQAALAECRAAGVQAAVAVVDRDGLAQVMLRDTLAPELAARVAQAKAYTSASFDAPSGALDAPERAALARMPGLLFAGGGLPIDAAGQRYGAIGVSGLPSAELDQRCARAGVDAIVPELEMR
jgi:uncharacterized protein GlcG (DUF336 family)